MQQRLSRGGRFEGAYMAITDEKITVLVLGAGTSVPFGLPLGGGMISDLSEAIKQELVFLNPADNDQPSQFESKLRHAARGLEIFF